MSPEKLIIRLSSLLSHISGIALALMMFIIAADVLLRNLGLAQINGVVDISKLLLVIVGGFSLAKAFIDEKHLVVEIATYKLSKRIQQRLEAFWIIIASVPFGILTYYLLKEGLTQHERGQVVGILDLTPLIHYSLASAACAVASLACLWVGYRKFTR